MQSSLVVTVFLSMSRFAAGGEFEFLQPLDPLRPCQVMATGGSRHQAPEQTGPAIEFAIGDLLEWVEVDVRRTKDGPLVLLRDATVDRTTNGRGAVNELTLAQLRELDAGSWFAPRFAGVRVLTLQECFALAKGRINLYLNCHDIDAEQLAREIESAAITRQVVIAATPEQAATIRKVSTGKIAVALPWLPSVDIEQVVQHEAPAIVDIRIDQISPAVCEAFHRHGVRVRATFGSEQDHAESWKQALNASVDFVRTDLPEEFVAIALFSRIDKSPVEFSLHRGAKRYAAENTAAAFEKSVRLHADYVEFDVRTTADGRQFLLHDGSLDRTTNGHGPFAKATAAAVQKLDAGSWFSGEFAGAQVLELDAFLSLIGRRSKLYFDAKALPPEALAAALQRHDLVEQTVVFQGPGYLAKLRAIDPRIKTMPPLYRPEQLERLSESLKPYAVDVAWEILSPELIRRCHDLGIRVFSDSIGKTDITAEHRKAIGWGIDLIQTDEPLQLFRAIELLATASAATR